MDEQEVAIFTYVVIFVIAAALVIRRIKAWIAGRTPRVCASCGHLGRPERAVKGSLGLEVVLWLLFIIPGVIYSTWRGSSRHWACAACGRDELVPAHSPRGQQLVKELHVTNPRSEGGR